MIKTKRIELEEMPFDKVFETENGQELCHSTGYEVELSGSWWVEYIDSDGQLHYGR